MKKALLFFGFFYMIVTLMSQSYTISFQAQGSSTIVDSVLIENLSQGTKLKMNGSDVLKLVLPIGVDEYNNNINGGLSIYPNPFLDICNIKFEVPSSGNSLINIYDLLGRLIYSKNENLEKGQTLIQLKGIPLGVYMIQVAGVDYDYFGKLISNHPNKSDHTETIVYEALHEIHDNKDKEKSFYIEMPYQEGDRLKFTGFSDLNGLYKTVVMLIPTSSQIVTFHFHACSDADGYHYAIVEIGDQIWMAENLRYLPSVVGPSIGSNTDPMYYVYGYSGNNVADAKATEFYKTYGVLYNWPAAMAGSMSGSEVQGHCPMGWHLSTDAEWTQLINFLGGETIAGKKLKATSTWYWNSNMPDNESGFSALPGGYYYYQMNILTGIKSDGLWWTSTQGDSNNSWCRVMNDYSFEVGRINEYRRVAMSVRCVKNE